MEIDDISITVIAAILVVCAVTSLLFIHFAIPEEGEHEGYITEVGYGGIIFKTHHIKVVDAHFSTDSNKDSSYKNYWIYGIKENEAATNNILDNAKVFLMTDHKVKVKYKCELIIPIWETSDACYVTEIIGV